MLRRLAFTLAALTLLASNTYAQWSTFIDYSDQCLSGGFYTCASVQVYTLRVPTGTYVEIRIRNLMSGNAVVSSWEIYERQYGQWAGDLGPAAGLPGFTSGPHGSVETIGPDPMLGMDMSNGVGHVDPDGFPHDNLFGYFGRGPQGFAGVVGCENNLPVPTWDAGDALYPSGFYRTCPSQGFDGWWGFTLSLPNVVTASDFVVFDVGGHNYGEPPPVVTPEPVTMTLLATGLAGVGGAAWRRRKQKVDDRAD